MQKVGKWQNFANSNLEQCTIHHIFIIKASKDFYGNSIWVYLSQYLNTYHSLSLTLSSILTSILILAHLTQYKPSTTQAASDSIQTNQRLQHKKLWGNL